MAQADEEARELASHNWFPASQTYGPGSWGAGAWALAFLTMVFLVGIIVFVYMLASKPAGELVVVYEYRPPTRTPAMTAVAAQVGPAVAMSPNDDTKTCPQCAEQVKAAALVCRFCRYEFGPTPPSGQPGV